MMEKSRAWYSKWVDGKNTEESRGSIVREVLRYHPLSKQIRKLLQDRQRLVFLYLDIVGFAEMERRFGEVAAADLLHLVETSIRKVSKETFTEQQLLEVENFWGDDFLICYQEEHDVDERALYELVTSLRQKMVQEINVSRSPLLSAPLDLHIGYAVMQNTYEPLERQLYLVIKQAVRMARKTAFGGDELYKEFQDVLQARQIQAVYQPIISLETGEPLGWEALSRGPKGSRFERPDMLFGFAEEAGDLYKLERICRERAIEKATQLPELAKLFVNINPRTINDPSFTKGETKRLLDHYELSPSQIVFEITERHSIQDYHAFRKTLEHYRQQGYLIAVDDAGAGYSSLQSIVELAPDFIKMDMSLVRGIHNDPVKQALLEAFVTLARKIKCKIIAEGIEEEAEAKTLLALGIDYGQGFLLGRPRPDMTTSVSASMHALIQRRRDERMQLASHSKLQIGTIATSTFVVPPEMTIQKVRELLEKRRQISSVVVVEQGQAVGLLTRDYLFAMLGSQYGVPLYYKRPVKELMDPHPLVVETHMLIDEVSALATGRNNLKRYDDIIVTYQGEYRGVVSVQTLLDVMSKVKIEIAKYANPLTGLPGNLPIEEELRTQLRRGDAFSVWYVDLDHFKQFNDQYGFELGDQMILFLSQLLHHQLSKEAKGQGFLGHIGGDDIVMITPEEFVEPLVRRIIRLFDRVVQSRLRRLPNPGSQRPLSVSVAVLDIPAQSDIEPMMISARCAELKKKAKQLAGSSFVRETGGRQTGGH